MQKLLPCLLLLSLLSGFAACTAEREREPMIEEIVDPAHPEGEPVYDGGETENGAENTPTPSERYP